MAKNTKATATEAVKANVVPGENGTIEEVKATATEAELIEVLIQPDPLNPKDKEVIVGINDKYAKIVRGVPTKVPKAVWEQLRNAKLV